LTKYNVQYIERGTYERVVDAVVECDDGDPVKKVLNKEFVKWLPVRAEMEGEVDLESIKIQ
jgi:hypothetical protein